MPVVGLAVVGCWYTDFLPGVWPTFNPMLELRPLSIAVCGLIVAIEAEACRVPVSGTPLIFLNLASRRP